MKLVTVRDLETGEIESTRKFDPAAYERGLIAKKARTLAGIEKRITKKQTGGFAMYFFNQLDKASTELTGAEFRVLGHLLPRIGFENEWIAVSHASIARKLKMSRTTVIAAMAKLDVEGYICQVKKDGECYCKIAPNLGWKGNRENRLKVVAGGQWKTEPALPGAAL